MCVCVFQMSHILKHFIVQVYSQYSSIFDHFCFILYTRFIYKPGLSLSLPASSSLLLFKDLCGPHTRQEPLILRLGRPYTLLLCILHAYMESCEDHSEKCSFYMDILKRKGTPPIKRRPHIALIGSAINFLQYSSTHIHSTELWQR